MSFLNKLFNPNNRKLKELRLEANQLQKELGSKPSVAALEKLAAVLAELVKIGDGEAHLVLAITYFNLIKARLNWKEPEPWLIAKLSPEEQSKILLDATGGLLMLDEFSKAGGKPKNEAGQQQLDHLKQTLQQIASSSRQRLETMQSQTSPASIPQDPKDGSKPTLDMKEVMRKYWKHEAIKWWEVNPDRVSDAVCDGCSSPISPADSFYFVLGRRMKCNACMERSLANWEESKFSNTYFGHNEVATAMEYYISIVSAPKN